MPLAEPGAQMGFYVWTMVVLAIFYVFAQDWDILEGVRDSSYVPLNRLFDNRWSKFI